MKRFRDKYRIASIRLQNWNYGWNGAYFITICTANRECFFGIIKNGKMILNELGDVARTEWMKTPGKRPDMNILLGTFVVMPNHFHAILHIGKNEFNNGNRQRTTQYGGNCKNATHCRDAMHCVSTVNGTVNDAVNDTVKNTITDKIPDIPKNNFGPQSKNLASIVRGFKSSVTTFARKNDVDFNWQSRFHDHIIRNRAEYKKIQQYIRNNPVNWWDDNFFSL